MRSKLTSGCNHPNYGKHRSETTKEAISAARLLRIYPTQDTKPEVTLQNALRTASISFVTHIAIVGQPDIFIEPNICVFVDGDYWHCNPKYYPNPVSERQQEIVRRSEYVNRKLQEYGYTVLRFWDKDDIQADIIGCVEQIKSAILWNTLNEEMQQNKSIMLWNTLNIKKSK